MSVSDWNRIGNQLREAVEDSLNTGNFQQLGDALSDTVNSALAEARRQVEAYQSKSSATYQNPRQEDDNPGQGSDSSGKSGTSGQGGYNSRQNSASGQGNSFQQAVNHFRQNGTGWNGGGSAFQGGQWYNNGGWNGNQQKRPHFQPVKMNKVGRISSVLLMVFGGIGTGVMAVGLFVLLLTLMITWAWEPDLLTAIGIVGFLLAFSILMIRKGCKLKDRLKRALRYVQICGHCHYINVVDLAAQMGNTVKYTLKDIKKMLKAGFFPEGHLDQEDTCLMLDDATYRQYLAIQKERKAREMEEKVARMRERQQAGPENPSVPFQAGQAPENMGPPPVPENPELDAMVREGQEYIKKLREMNDNIEGEVISSKLFQLENLLKEIFERVREHPEQMPRMQKFMKYYLPTTLKLVEAYEDFDSVSVPGEDILSAKKEIEKTLDTINQAFTELLNRLFRDSVYDATTDAQVLQTMLAQEGLMKTPEFDKVSR